MARKVISERSSGKVIGNSIRIIKRAKSGALNDEELLLKRVARNASSVAVRISKALDLPVQYVEKGKLIEESANGEKKTIKEVKKVKSKLDLSKGVTIWLNQKG